jgi:hypothetical protein
MIHNLTPKLELLITLTNLPLPFKGRAREGSFRKHNPVINVY